MLLASAEVKARPAVVVVDPGHGGFDRGGMNDRSLAIYCLEFDPIRIRPVRVRCDFVGRSRV